MRNIIVSLALILCLGAMQAGASEPGLVLTSARAGESIHVPQGVVLFDLHDPGLMSEWGDFLATTRMLNERPLPQAMQKRLADVVSTYRLLTPPHQPQFFVATDLDVLGQRLLAARTAESGGILPLRDCPVFASAGNAPVSSLLAVVSGMPVEVFANAPGRPAHYRSLLLQTEFSHCRTLASIRPADPPDELRTTSGLIRSGAAHLTFNVGTQAHTAIVNTTRDLRALIEAVGDVEATTNFRAGSPSKTNIDEVDVFIFVRLLSSLATDANHGYAAIPMLYSRLVERSKQPPGVDTESLKIADVLEQSVQARAVFKMIVPSPIRNTHDLMRARVAVLEALSNKAVNVPENPHITALLNQFVQGSEMLLATTVAEMRMPPSNH